MERDDIERMRARVEELRARQQSLLEREFTASSEDGYVTATVDGSGKFTGLKLNPRVFRNPDSEGLATQIIAQYDAACDQARAAWAEAEQDDPTSGAATQREAGRLLHEAVSDSEARGEAYR